MYFSLLDDLDQVPLPLFWKEGNTAKGCALTRCFAKQQGHLTVSAKIHSKDMTGDPGGRFGHGGPASTPSPAQLTLLQRYRHGSAVSRPFRSDLIALPAPTPFQVPEIHRWRSHTQPSLAPHCPPAGLPLLTSIAVEWTGNSKTGLDANTLQMGIWHQEALFPSVT